MGKTPHDRSNSHVVKATLDRVADQLNAVVELELAESVLDVVLHRAVRDDKPLCDLTVTQTLGDKAQHLRLALGQPGDVRIAGGGTGSGGGGEPPVLTEYETRQAGSED